MTSSGAAAPSTVNRLDTVSIRLRVTASVVVVMAASLVLLSVSVLAAFAAQSNRSTDRLLVGRAALAQQLAAQGAGPAQIVNRVSADGVQARLVLRNGTAFGTVLPSGTQVRTSTVLPWPAWDGSAVPCWAWLSIPRW